MKQIVNDLGEEDTGAGFSEIFKTGVFTTKIILWEDATKTKKRTETTFNRVGAFMSTIVKEVFDEEEGLIKVATSSASFTRDGQNLVLDATVLNTRP
jgi:hypothetical protein